MVEACRSLVPAAEAEAATAGAVTPQAAEERLLSSALRRWALARYCGTPAAALRFTRGPHGKPELLQEPLSGARRLSFSVAHTAGALLCAVACAPLGVDVEQRDRGSPGLATRLAARYFTSAEQAALAALPEPARAGAFLQLWTLKEAYVKALGRGIAAAPLASFAISLHDAPGTPSRRVELDHMGSPHASADGEPVPAWQLALLALPGGAHVAALAAGAAPGAGPLRLRLWRTELQEEGEAQAVEVLAVGRTQRA